jgi:hypothetical protein
MAKRLIKAEAVNEYLRVKVSIQIQTNGLTSDEVPQNE